MVDRQALPRDLRAAGLPVVPTMFVEPGERFPLLEAEVVVKPTESGGSRDTERYDPESEKDAALLAARIHRSGRTVMVQPYLAGVEAPRRDRAPVFRRRVLARDPQGPDAAPRPGRQPRACSSRSRSAPASRPPPSAPSATAQSRMSTERFGPLAYARVDLLPALGGHLVLELELVEPSLFLTRAQGAPERFARVIAEPSHRRPSHRAREQQRGEAASAPRALRGGRRRHRTPWRHPDGPHPAQHPQEPPERAGAASPRRPPETAVDRPPTDLLH